jgi:hypothetical protein
VMAVNRQSSLNDALKSPFLEISAIQFSTKMLTN